MRNPYALVMLIVMTAIGVIGLLRSRRYFRLWFRAVMGNAHIPMRVLLRLSLRGLNPRTMTDTLIRARRAGLPLEIHDLETHAEAGGDVARVTQALIAASRADIPLTWQRACAIDLAGRDVREAVQMAVQTGTTRGLD